MAEVYGNVNVNYSYCKSVAQLKSAADYILGTKKEQIKEGIQKTRADLYGAFGCNRDNFANSLLITWHERAMPRKMHDKKYSRYKQKDILAQKMSIFFHPDDNDKLTYEEADKIAREFAHKFFWSKGYEAMWAVHTDTEHIHVHFIVSNCNVKTGKSFRRGMPELKEMSQFFGEQCMEWGLTHSVRDTFYNEERTQERKSFAECQMQKHDKLSFREEIKTYVRLAMNSTEIRTLAEKGDIFFTRTSETIEEVGFSCVCEETIPNATFAGFVIRVRPFDDTLYTGYSKYYFRSSHHRAYLVKEMNLVTRASLGQDLLKSMPVVIPPMEEQRKIAEFLDEKCSAIDNTIKSKQKIIDKITAYKKSLIYEAVTGKKEELLQ